MAESLYDIIAPHLGAAAAAAPSTLSTTVNGNDIPGPDDPATAEYLTAITRLSLSALTISEPRQLSTEAHSITRSLQTLASRSYRAILTSSVQLTCLADDVPHIRTAVHQLHSDTIPALDSAAARFAKTYSRPAVNARLARRREILNLAAKADRISDMLEIPALLSPAIAISTSSAINQAGGPSASATTAASASTASSSAVVNANYTAALDLVAHVGRLTVRYPDSTLVRLIDQQAGEEMKKMTVNLISSLQSKQIKLAGAVRTIGWLRRIAPELAASWDWHAADDTKTDIQASKTTTGPVPSNQDSEGALGAILLLGRLANLISTLDALEPLRRLAEHESLARQSTGAADGHQTERYLKRYIEVFREHSFAIISMFKAIFPASTDAAGSSGSKTEGIDDIPSALASFPLHMVEILFSALRRYLPNIRDGSSRENICSQVLFCSNSLGRLGANFGLMLASLLDELDGYDDDDDDCDQDPEWVDVFKKHRVQVSRLEMLASGANLPR